MLIEGYRKSEKEKLSKGIFLFQNLFLFFFVIKENVEQYKHLIMLDLDEKGLKDLSKGDELVMEYEKKVVDLNEEETFQSAMSYEEDQKLILNIEKKIALEQGREEAIKELAKNMLTDNVSIEKIQEYTGLSKEEIENLGR